MGFRQSQGKNKKSPRPAAAAAAQQAETLKRASKHGAERDTRPPTRAGDGADDSAVRQQRKKQ
jgi:hypothetical protein